MKEGNAVSFIRCFDNKYPSSDDALYQKLLHDIKHPNEKDAVVFPAIRVNRIDFYYGGGVLFCYNGTSFSRNRAYDKYDGSKVKTDEYKKGYVTEKNYGKNFVDNYDFFKCCNITRFKDDSEKAKERQFLEKLYKDTYATSGLSKICVLDIEVRLNEDDRKKCDMVLLNTETAQVMFVEGKIYQDDRMGGNPPPVIEQVCGYSKQVKKHQNEIEAAYNNYIAIVNPLLGCSYPTRISLVLPAKLLVYSKTSENPRRKSATAMIKEHIGKSNIMWNWNGHEPSLDDIWNCLTR